MPLKITLDVRDQRFEAEGDFAINDAGLVSVVEAWLRALGPDPTQLDIDALAARTEQQVDNLSAARQPTGHTPTTTGV